MTPTARSAKWLAERGWIVAKIEQRIYMPNAPYPVTRDAFGFGDLLAARPAGGMIALYQVTGGQGGNLMARVRKIIEGEEGDRTIPEKAISWCMAGGLILCHGWARRKPRGVKRPQWTLKVKQVQIRRGADNEPELYWADLETPA